MNIGYLADHEEMIPALVRWHHQEWAYLRPGDTIEARTARLRESCGRKQVPTVVVGYIDSTLVGSAMLVACDMSIRSECSPWLAGVFVAKEFRGRGFGTALVHRVESEAGDLGFTQIFLYTPSSAEFYSKLGWTEKERTVYREVDVVVMTKQIQPKRASLPAPTPTAKL